MVSSENISACVGDSEPSAVDVVKSGNTKAMVVSGMMTERYADAPFRVVGLLVVPDTAHQQAQPHDSVEHDHQHGVHGVASQRRVAFRAQHDCGDQYHLDDYDREREHQRAQRLSQHVSERFGLMYDAECHVDDDEEKPYKQAERHRVMVEARHP